MFDSTLVVAGNNFNLPGNGDAGHDLFADDIVHNLMEITGELKHDIVITTADVQDEGVLLHHGESVVWYTDVHMRVVTPTWRQRLLRFVFGADVVMTLILKDRGGIATKYNLHVLAGVIDESYDGVILVKMTNVGSDPVFMSYGQKIAQAVIIPTLRFEEDNTELVDSEDFGWLVSEKYTRGVDGFGSTG